MPKLGEAFVVIRASLAPLKRGLAMAKKIVRSSMAVMGKMMRKLSRIGRRVFLGFVAAVTLTTTAFVKFQQQLANVSTMLDDATLHFLPEYAIRLKDLAVTFGESTKTLSGGLYDILSASVAPARAMNVLEVAVKAAKAGLTNTAVAADAITTVLNSYQMSVEDASKVSDILFATVKRGKTTFAELAFAIGKVTAIGSVAGISFEELSAAIATMTRAGLQVDIATTAMRGLINAFLKPTSEAQKMAKKFGFELSSVTLKSLGLVGVLKKLKGATGEQLAALIPNIRGMAGFAASLKAAKGQASDLKLMLNSTGLTQIAFDKMTNTLAFDLSRLRQTFTILAVEIGAELAPVIKRIANEMRVWLTENKERIRDWGTSVAKAITVVVGKIKELIELIETGRLSNAIKKEFPKLTAFLSLVGGAGRLAGKTASFLAEQPANVITTGMLLAGAGGRVVKGTPAVMEGARAVTVLERIERNTRQDRVG
ncbi:hypothetical protein LCGC14_0421540 [marine sediment metagenome]|uniref:Phage tail tape measure protein domain-containing protein n=1 Tax=marine sediment metagenome TaxID=412755 RepID=A0A0F9T8W6_9ZZZZ